MARPSAREGFASLANLLDPRSPVIVQTHDYPDIDAVASAWALAELLSRRGFASSCAYRGELRSRSLGRLVAELGIAISPTVPARDDLQLIVVDGSPANGNVRLFPGRLVGVVDHHHVDAEPLAPFLDLRPELASCSSIVYCYWVEASEEPTRDFATALLAGIQSDTDFLSRRSSAADFHSYTLLFGLGDWERASRIVRTVLDLRELGLLTQALSTARVEEGLLYAFMEGPCGQEALAVAADFALRSEELSAAVVAESDASGVHLSVRSKSPELSAFSLVKRALAGIGSGGGHSHSAGGIIPTETSPGEDAIRERFFKAAKETVTAAHPDMYPSR